MKAKKTKPIWLLERFGWRFH